MRVEKSGQARSKDATDDSQRVEVLVPLERRSPLNDVPPPLKRAVAGYLTFTDATRLKLVSMGVALSLRDDRRLTIVGEAFVGGNRLILELAALDAQIAQAAATRDRRCLPSLRREPDTHLAKRALTAARLQALEPEFEVIAIHFSTAAGGRQAPQAAPHLTAPDRLLYGAWHNAIYDGEVAVVRHSLNAFLNLSPSLIPNGRKIARLLGPRGIDPLQSIGGRRTGICDEPERNRYDALRAYVSEIAGANSLSTDQKIRLCDFVRHASDCGNFAVASSILLGVQDAAAPPELKAAIFAAILGRSGGIPACVDGICEKLATLTALPGRGAWINARIAELERLKG
jgi:hypothetical protein